MTSSDDSGSAGSSVPQIAASRPSAAPVRLLAEIGAVAILSCVIVGSASALRHEKAGDASPPAERSDKKPAAGSTERRDAPKTGPWILADPNPVPFAGDKGTTTITWLAAGMNDAKVYLRSADREELLSGGSQGEQTIDWIAPGGVYEFVLYADAEKKKELATLKVTRPAQ